MGRGAATASGGRVDDIVVDQGTGLVQLEGRPETRGGGTRHETGSLLRCGPRLTQGEADGAEQRAHPLARGHQVRGRVEQLIGGGRLAGASGTMSVQGPGESGLDGGVHRLERGGEGTHAHQRNGRPDRAVDRGRDRRWWE